MEDKNYIMVLGRIYDLRESIQEAFEDVSKDTHFLQKCLKACQTREALLALGGFALLYLVAKLSSRVMALEAAQKDSEEEKGE